MTDTDKLLAILERHGTWCSQNAILNECHVLYRHGMTVHSRASDLRKRGVNVECKVETVNGRRRSWYRVMP